MDINFEHRFWLQILGDHMRLIKRRLAITEEQLIETTLLLQGEADYLLQQARNGDDVTTLAIGLTKSVKELKLDIMQKQLTGKVSIALPVTFINHMVNELDMYADILQAEQAGLDFTDVHNLVHHNLWLLDAKGHVESIISDLDPTEKVYLRKLKPLKKKFGLLYEQAREFAGYLRAIPANNPTFPALDKLAKTVDLEMHVFMNYLREMQTLRMDNTLLGPLDPLVLDHMMRETLYYLRKIGFNVANPSKPRIDA